MTPEHWFRISTLLAITLLAAPLDASCPADLDGDGGVGLADQSLLFDHYGPVDPDDPVKARLDLNGNGHICGADLAVLHGHWGACSVCPADLDGSGEVDEADRQALELDSGLECHSDLDRSGVVGEHDLQILQLAMSGNPHPDTDPRADLDGNGLYDEADLDLLLADFGLDCRADLDHNGRVDRGDLWLLLGAWGPCAPAPEPPWPVSAIEGRPPEQCDPKE